MTAPVRISHADFEAMLALPENADRRLELIDGEIVEKMPTRLHSYLVGLIVQALLNYLDQHPVAYAGPEPRFRPAPDADHDLIPDAAVWSLDYGLSDESVMVGVPDLAVEVQSPGQSDRFMQDKANVYLQHGCPMVWLVYPRVKLVEVLTPASRALLGVHDTLDGGEVLPGFSLPVNRLFERLPEGR